MLEGEREEWIGRHIHLIIIIDMSIIFPGIDQVDLKLKFCTCPFVPVKLRILLSFILGSGDIQSFV